MRVELTVPKETEESVAYIENGGQEQIVFKRGKSYVLDKKSAKKSTENGNDVLVIKAQLSSSPKSEFKEFTDKRQAVEFLQQEFKDFSNTLTIEQKGVLRDVKDPTSTKLTEVNKELEMYRGNQTLMSEQTKRFSRLIDSSLNNATLKENLYVHVPLTSEEIGISNLYLPNHTIDTTKVKQLLKDFNYGILNKFLTVTLTKQNTSVEKPVVLKLGISKGTNVGYLDEERLLVSRDHGIEITKSGMSKDNTSIELEGVLVPKEEINQKIKQAENNLNEAYKDLAATEKPLLSFEINGFYASSVVSRAKELFLALTQNIKSSIISSCVKKMDDTNRGAFLFTDKVLKNYYNKADESFLAFYSPTEKRLYIEVNQMYHLSSGRLDPLTMTGGQDIDSIIHEFGHAVDHLLLNLVSINNPEFKQMYSKYYSQFIEGATRQIQNVSGGQLRIEDIKKIVDYFITGTGLTETEMKNWQSILYESGQKIREYINKNGLMNDYMYTNAKEFFAVLFAYMYSVNTKDREQVKKTYQDVVDFIQKQINQIR
ncbi:hypothetical protein ACLBXI_29305 [Bacillus cereus]